MRLGLQPFADVPGAPLTIGRPVLGEAVVDDIASLDTERVLDDLGGAVTIVAVDRSLPGWMPKRLTNFYYSRITNNERYLQ
jgi:hypothetical protein